MRIHGNARGWAWGIVAAVALSQAGWVGLLAASRSRVPTLVADQFPIHAEAAVLVTVIAALGALIIGKHPGHPVGWIMCAAAGTVVLDALARAYAVDGLYLRPGVLPGPEYAAWWVEWSWFPAVIGLLVFLPLFFPDGHLPSSRWRPVAIGMVIWLVLASVGYALVPAEPVDFPGVEKAVQFQPAIALSVLMLLAPVALAVSFGSVMIRRRRAVGVEREQLRWFMYAVGVAVVCWALSFGIGAFGGGTWGIFGAVLTHGPIFLIVGSIGAAILTYRLYDIDLLINRTLVYGGLTGSALLVYGLVVLAVSRLTTADIQWRGSVMVVALVAIAAYPLREWLQSGVNHLMYGDRDDPARAMSRLSMRVADALTPAGLLAAVAETIGQALRLPYVAIQLPGETPPVTYGSAGALAERFPLVHQGEPVGTLVVGRRAEKEQFSAADLRVLEDLSRQVAAAAHAVRLSDELQRSREALVLAREEERLRLRRDLHDGVGSALAGLALQAGNARQSLPTDPEGAARWVSGLEDGIRSAVLDIRRIVDDLRPPALDELGLAVALRERADALLPGVVSVTVAAGPLPAAVEVAAYRIATEAMTNAARHSEAQSVTLDVSTSSGALLLVVADDGSGLPLRVSPGVGIRSMRERANELGGSCEIASETGRGATVRAVLPVTGERSRDG